MLWGGVGGRYIRRMALFMLRHASTELNAGDPADPKDYFRGWANVALSAYGKRMNQASARFLAKQKIAHIYSSDLLRAKQTAHTAGQATKAPITYDKRLRPWDIGKLLSRIGTATRLAGGRRSGDGPVPRVSDLSDVVPDTTDHPIEAS